MKRIRLWGSAGSFLLRTVVLAGCSLLFPSPQEEAVASEVKVVSGDTWLLAAQGQEEPAACKQDLSRREARQEAKEALAEEEEAQELEQVLASLGKRLMVWRAQGCEVSTEEEGSGSESDTSGQGLFAQQAEGPETILVEVPAGPDAALYLVETRGLDEENYWISLREEVEGGERLIHIEVGLEGEAEVQGLGADAGAVSFFLPDEDGAHVKDLIDLWSRMSEAERNAFIRALILIYGSPIPEAAAEDFYGRTSPEGQAYTKVIDGIIQALQRHVGLSREQAKQEALRIMGVFVATLKASSNAGLLIDIVTHAGVVGIIAFVKLLDAQQYADEKYAFPEDIISFFEKLLQLKQIIRGWNLFMQHPAAAAMQAAANRNRDAALEMIARLTLLQDLFFKMHARGWENLTYGYSSCGLEPGTCAYFGFRAGKDFNVSGIGKYYWNVFGWMEPHLSPNDVDRILQQIDNAVNWAFKTFMNPIVNSWYDPSLDKVAIVQVIDDYDPAALDELCSRVSARGYGIPVVTLAGGRVACHSVDVSDQGAQAICVQMGLCGDPSPPSSDQASSDGGGPPPEGTYSLPIGNPDTGGVSVRRETLHRVIGEG